MDHRQLRCKRVLCWILNFISSDGSDTPRKFLESSRAVEMGPQIKTKSLKVFFLRITFMKKKQLIGWSLMSHEPITVYQFEFRLKIIFLTESGFQESRDDVRSYFPCGTSFTGIFGKLSSQDSEIFPREKTDCSAILYTLYTLA